MSPMLHLAAMTAESCEHIINATMDVLDRSMRMMIDSDEGRYHGIGTLGGYMKGFIYGLEETATDFGHAYGLGAADRRILLDLCAYREPALRSIIRGRMSILVPVIRKMHETKPAETKAFLEDLLTLRLSDPAGSARQGAQPREGLPEIALSDSVRHRRGPRGGPVPRAACLKKAVIRISFVTLLFFLMIECVSPRSRSRAPRPGRRPSEGLTQLYHRRRLEHLRHAGGGGGRDHLGSGQQGHLRLGHGLRERGATRSEDQENAGRAAAALREQRLHPQRPAAVRRVRLLPRPRGLRTRRPRVDLGSSRARTSSGGPG